MISFYKKKYYFQLPAFLLAFLFLFLFTSCSKESEAPPPPHLKAQLVSELFSALSQKNYEMALNRVDRLREIDSDNVALQSMQVNIQNNFIMQKAQDLLDKGDVDGAINTINDFAAANGQTTELRNAISQLNVLKDISIIINNSILNTSLASENSARIFLPEEDSAIEDLKADIDINWVTGSDNIDTLVAILETQKANDSFVAYFKSIMNTNWKDFDIASNYLGANSEILIFRILASSSFDAKNKQLIKKITSYSPNSYRDKLSKAIMLNFISEVEKSNGMLDDMKNQLQVPDNTYKSWFTFIPKNNSLDNLNPLVRNPFFIYCNQNATIKAQ